MAQYKRKNLTHITEDGREFTIPAGITVERKRGNVFFKINRMATGARHLTVSASMFKSADHAFQYACDVLKRNMLKAGIPARAFSVERGAKTVSVIPGVLAYAELNVVYWCGWDSRGNSTNEHVLVSEGTYEERVSLAICRRKEALANELERQLSNIPNDVVDVVLNCYGNPLKT